MAIKKIGALWKKKDKNKNDFYAGELDLGVLGKVNLAIFPNQKKEDNHPDFTIHLLPSQKEPY